MIAGVRGTYDRHEFKDEKLRAFELLAREVERIINPPPGDVVDLTKRRAKK